MDEIDQFKNFLRREKGQSDRTLKTNLKILRKLLLIGLNKKSVDKFIDSCLDRRLAPSYIKQHVSLVRQWGEYYSIKDLKKYPYPKISYSTDFVRSIFNDEEVHSFLNAPNPHEKGRYAERYNMWILFYKILFFHGMRTIEVAQLTVDEVDFGRNAFVIPPSKSKTHKERIIPLSPEVKNELIEYIQALQTEYLFTPFHAKNTNLHVGGEDWRGFFNKQCARLGIKRKNLTPYSTRHTYGSRQVEEDVNLFKIKEIMGHNKIETTMKYLHTSLKSLQEVQDNDRLRNLKGKTILKKLIDLCSENEKKYREKVLVNITKSLDGTHAVIDVTVLDA